MASKCVTLPVVVHLSARISGKGYFLWHDRVIIIMIRPWVQISSELSFLTGSKIQNKKKQENKTVFT